MHLWYNNLILATLRRSGNIIISFLIGQIFVHTKFQITIASPSPRRGPCDSLTLFWLGGLVFDIWDYFNTGYLMLFMRIILAMQMFFDKFITAQDSIWQYCTGRTSLISPLSWQRLRTFSSSSAIHLDIYTWIVPGLRCSLQKMTKEKCHDKTEYQPRRCWRGTCGRGVGTTRCSTMPTSAGCSPAQCPSQRAVWSSPIITWPKHGTKITPQMPPHTNVPTHQPCTMCTYQPVPSYVGQSCIKTGFIASSFFTCNCATFALQY